MHGLADDQLEQVYITYSDQFGVYCRFGDLPVLMFDHKYFGGIYVTYLNQETKQPIKISQSWNTVRVPVGFEVWPGNHVDFSELAVMMGISESVIKSAYEQVIIPVHATMPIQ